MVSICFRKLPRASSFSLSPCVLSCFFRASSSSFWLLSSFCLGSSFFCRASKSRRPSFVPKMAPSILMVPTRVPVVAPVAGTEAAGEVGVGEEPGGAAALPVWARAVIAKKTVLARRIRSNLLVIGSVKLLVKRLLWSLGRLWRCRFGRRRACRLGGGRLRSRTAGGGRWHAGLCVVRVNHSFGNIDALSCP